MLTSCKSNSFHRYRTFLLAIKGAILFAAVTGDIVVECETEDKESADLPLLVPVPESSWSSVESPATSSIENPRDKGFAIVANSVSDTATGRVPPTNASLRGALIKVQCDGFIGDRKC